MKVILFVCLSQALLCTVVFGVPIENEDSCVQQVVQGTNKFTNKFYAQIASKNPGKNLFCSPVSISLLFSMILAGAKGQTQTEMINGLGFNTISEDNIHKGFKGLLQKLNQTNADLVLSIANALFVGKGTTLLESYLEKLKNYQAEAILTNFQNAAGAKSQINSYVDEKTHGLIKQVLDSVDPSTITVALNTIYFNGKWKEAFNKNLTKQANFHVDENTVIKVPMMTREGVYRAAHIQDPGCVLVKVPYEGNFSAIFIIPDLGKLQKVEEAVGNNSLPQWMEKMHNSQIILSFPKFDLSLPTLSLNKELATFGISRVFTSTADLSGITGAHNLQLSQALHKAAVKVDESGTEAAAVSVGVISTTSIDTRPLWLITADRPFIFHIEDNNAKITLFTGRIMDPLS